MVSVGPYPLDTMMPGQDRRTLRAAAGETMSPPAITSRTPRKQAGSSSASTRNRPAVTNRPVTSCAAMTAARPAASSRPGGATTIRPPFSNGVQISKVEASKAYGACISTRSCRPARQYGSDARRTTSRCVTATPFGVPVEPEVYITYTNCRASTATPVPAPVSASASAPPMSPSPTGSTGTSTVKPMSCRSRSVSNAVASVSRTMNSERTAGWFGSIGTYTPPAFDTASVDTTKPTERVWRTATRLSGPTPSRTSRRASRFARSSSSR